MGLYTIVEGGVGGWTPIGMIHFHLQTFAIILFLENIFCSTTNFANPKLLTLKLKDLYLKVEQMGVNTK